MKLTSFVMAGLLLFGLGSCKSKQKIAEIKPVVTETEKKTVEETKPEVEETRAEKFEIISEQPTIASKYFVVVGSFKNETNAKNLQSKLKSEGNSALIALNENQMFRVILASFDNYGSAKAKRNEVLNRFADAWILVQR